MTDRINVMLGAENARMDADIAFANLEMDLPISFSGRQIVVIRLLLERIYELEHRLISVETRIAHVEIGERPPANLRNLADLVSLAARTFGITEESVRDPKPRADPAIIVRQFICWFGHRRLGLAALEIAKAMGRVPPIEIMNAVRHYELRRNGCAERARFEEISNAWAGAK